MARIRRSRNGVAVLERAPSTNSCPGTVEATPIDPETTPAADLDSRGVEAITAEITTCAERRDAFNERVNFLSRVVSAKLARMRMNPYAKHIHPQATIDQIPLALPGC